MTNSANQEPGGTGVDETVDGSAEADLRTLFGRSTAVFASLAGPAHIVEAANAAFFSAIGGGGRVRTGVPLGQLMPELAEQGFMALLDQVHRSGKPFTGRDARVLLGTGAQAREAFFDFSYEPRLDSGGNVTGVRVLGVETTQVKQAQRLASEHRALLEQIARQASLEQVLDGMARVIEGLVPEEIAVSVLLADADGRHLRHGAAPSLPEHYNQAIDGIATGEGVGSCGTAAHRRQTVIVSDIAADPLWDDFRGLARTAGLAACWSTPILRADGALLGTFAMYHRTPRSPQEADLALARVFAKTAALAIERHQAEQARLAAEAKEQAARDDLAFLLQASTSLSTDLDYAQTLQRLARTCVPKLAPWCVVDVLETGRVRRIATAAATAEHDKVLATLAPARTDTDEAVSRVLASGVSEIARRAPESGPWADLGVTGYVCVPLTDRGRAFGAMTLLSGADRTFDGHTVALAEELARRASSAALNAHQYTQRAALARDLQAGLLLPQVPALPGAQLATYYHPAGEGLEVGGDFYDVFALPGDRWAFMLGDVCGRGATAAATTALVRHTARAVAPLLPGPREVAQAINRALLERPSSHGTGFVTLAYGHLTPSSGSGLHLTLVRAGHTLPLHIDSRHSVHPVDSEGCLLGVTTDPRFETRRLTLAPGESLLLYTDGITEARDKDGEQYGEQRLAHALSAARPATAQDVVTACTRGLRSFTGDADVDDDQAALVLTATSPHHR